MAYKDPSTQQTTKFTGKIFDKQIAQADADLRVMQAKKGTREVKVLDMDGDPTNSTKDGKSAALPKDAK